MTNLNSTQYDSALLVACKKYIQVTDITPELFVKELMDLASQHIDHLPEEILLSVQEEPIR